MRFIVEIGGKNREKRFCFKNSPPTIASGEAGLSIKMYQYKTSFLFIDILLSISIYTYKNHFNKNVSIKIYIYKKHFDKILSIKIYTYKKHFKK